MKATFSIGMDGSVEVPSSAGLWASDSMARLEWLGGRLRELGLCQESTVTQRRGQPSLDATVFAQRYRLLSLVGKPPEETIVLSLIKRSQTIDRLLGREPFDANDAFARVLQDVLEREASGVQAKVSVLWR